MHSGQDDATTSVVTGAFGFSGQRIADQLLLRGERVRTLTNHSRPGSRLFGRVEVAPLDFGNTEKLTASLQGAGVLYNSYWVRFAYGGVNHQNAVENTRRLLRAAAAAGVKRIVHLSVANPSLDSPLPYFRGKAEVEQAIQDSSLSYAILRPAVLFGKGDILINNIAYMLRRFPLFTIPGRGEYRIQPIFVDDLAALAIEGGRRADSYIVDAVGPETYTYTELVQMIRSAVGSRSVLVHVPPGMVRLGAAMMGFVLRDVVLTPDEIRGLMADLLVSHGAPTAHTPLSEWIRVNAGAVGKAYASEVGRHYRKG